MVLESTDKPPYLDPIADDCRLAEIFELQVIFKSMAGPFFETYGKAPCQDINPLNGA